MDSTSWLEGRLLCMPVATVLMPQKQEIGDIVYTDAMLCHHHGDALAGHGAAVPGNVRSRSLWLAYFRIALAKHPSVWSTVKLQE